MVVIHSLPSLYGGIQKTKLHLLHNTRIHTPEGHFEKSRRSTIGRIPDDCTLLSLDARLTIPIRVLCFEGSGSRPRSRPVRPVHLTGQAGPHRSDQPSVVVVHTSVFGLSFVTQPRNPVVLW
jgi:hypothetical protein